MLKSDRWFLNFVILSGEEVTNYTLLVVFAFLVVYKAKSKGCLPKRVLSNLLNSVSKRAVTRACLVSAAHEPKDAFPALTLIVEPQLSSPGLGQVALSTGAGTRNHSRGVKGIGPVGPAMSGPQREPTWT